MLRGGREILYLLGHFLHVAARSYFWVSYMSGRAPSTWCICCCLSQVISREQIGSGTSRIWSSTHVGFQCHSGSFTSCTTILVPWTSLSKQSCSCELASNSINISVWLWNATLLGQICRQPASSTWGDFQDPRGCLTPQVLPNLYLQSRFLDKHAYDEVWFRN